MEKFMNRCQLCPRNCRVDRMVQSGFCGEHDTVRVARAALHMWEEPCISGENGSGAVFFTGCVLRCVYCQNSQLASGQVGKEISVKRLGEIFLSLQEQKANNINLVTPTHFVPQIVKAIVMARDNGLTIPIVYNTGNYENVETIKMLDGLVDIYLPDFKYYDGNIAQKYSGAGDYFECASKSLAEMVRQIGKNTFNDEGIMQKGVIVRHLLLPGGLEDSKKVIRYLYETYGNNIYVSIMNQYTPMPGIEKKYPELSRKVRRKDYDRLVDYAIDLGIENGFIQEGDTAKESFIPDFDLKGL